MSTTGHRTVNRLRHHVAMTKRLLGNATFYAAAVALATYLADGESAAQRVTYLATAVLATFMSQRRRTDVTEHVTRFRDATGIRDEEMVIVTAHVEDLLSRAS